MSTYNIKNDFVLNEFYKPDWEELQEYHMQRRDLLTRQAKSMVCDDGYLKFSKILWDQIEVDNNVFLKCYDTYQHQTVGDYLN